MKQADLNKYSRSRRLHMRSSERIFCRSWSQDNSCLWCDETISFSSLSRSRNSATSRWSSCRCFCIVAFSNSATRA